MKLFHQKKAQSVFTVLIVMILLGLVYFGGFAGMVGQYGTAIVAEKGITGIEGFFWSNFNYFVAFFYIIALIGVGRYSL